MGHGSTWKNDENDGLARAWLAVSENPIVGTNQTGTQMWEAIFKHFSSALTGTKWTAKALEVRWSSMQRDVSKFCAIHSQLSASHPIIQWNKTYLILLDKDKRATGADFRYMQSWEIRRVASKFDCSLAKGQAGTKGASDASGGKRQHDEVREHPLGTKKAKTMQENQRMRQRELQ